MVPVVTGTPRLAGSLAERVPLMGGEGEILPSFSYLLTHNLITALHAPFERARSDRSTSVNHTFVMSYMTSAVSSGFGQR